MRSGLGDSATVWDLPSAPAAFLAGSAAFVWFRRILLVIARLSAYHGVFSQMSKLLLGIPGAGASFLSGRDRALPTAMTVVTRPKPWHKHSFNNYIGYKLLLVHILIHVVNKHKVVGTHFFFLGWRALSVKSQNSWC